MGEVVIEAVVEVENVMAVVFVFFLIVVAFKVAFIPLLSFLLTT